MKYPARFPVDAVDRIVELVAPRLDEVPELDRHQFSLDLDRAHFWCQTFKDASLSGTKKRGDELIRKAQAFIDLWDEADNEGQWWRTQLGPYADFVSAMRDFEEIAEHFRPGRDAPLKLESVSKWFVGEHLATIFESHFQKKATAWITETTDKSGNTIVDKVSAYVAFVLAFIEEGHCDPIPATTIVRYRKQVKTEQGK
ncbi:hypothetical protein EN745_28970 [Mesorhizobium sp. M4A.F.Ca.ET.022.05.2.1]|uniref:hypothetical protein n=1 Tax=Mesorhizobium sp. M4A.F.Ca.ET.022.05.2.1 TaxID=2496653 RepID=UPI000FCB2154|nr:hypothetical protein [Mesorhizobium sp. M4A.F.Ca.ET.022.05.2.1]RVC74902.1 hypothetical protein EN745_28970 [Mesorhizobium sp. M4A.F.Ca.ET.022.05.2.1]